MERSFTTWLSEEINERGWSVRELGRRAGFSHSAISIVLAGERAPSWDMCAAIAKPLGVDVETVFRIAGLLPKTPDPQSDLSLRELMDVAKNLTPDQRRDLLDYARWRLGQHLSGSGDRAGQA